jgi:chemotaxis protein MotB
LTSPQPKPFSVSCHKLPSPYYIGWLSAAALLFALTGCVSQSTYDALKEENLTLLKDQNALNSNLTLLKNNISNLETEKQKLQARLEEINTDLSHKSRELDSTSKKLTSTFDQLQSTSQELSQKSQQLDSSYQKLVETASELDQKKAALAKTQMELAAAAEYVKRTHKLYDDLVGDLKSELAANEIKINKIKDGINLNLSQDILFPSGSATLNDSGIAVLTKVSKKLLENKYQVMVSGFTDNVPIRGSLTSKYPTNWELAGARAASVVRVFEKVGVSSELLMAVSFGENKPVASNDNPTDRALNRRIEIRLKQANI